MPLTCSRCEEPAVILLRYSGEHQCRLHFIRFVEKRVLRDLRKQGPFPRGSRIVVALSGGKDSVVALRLVKHAFRDRQDIDVRGLTVDEGIANYRPPSIKVAEEHCAELGVPFDVVSYQQQAGLTMDLVVKQRPDAPACATCGPLRRRALNQGAKQVGATHVVTGHNLDDTAQTILMNYARGDITRLSRLGPHDKPKPGLIPRIMPLRSIPEKEVALYAILKGWAFHDGDCPYASDATRGRYRDTLLAMERDEPGTRHAIVRGYDKLAPLLHAGLDDAPFSACETCGEPTGGAVECAACRKARESGVPAA